MLRRITNFGNGALEKVGLASAYRNLRISADPGHQGGEVVARLEGGERNCRLERLLGREHRVLEHAGEAPHHDMRAAQVGFREGRDDRAVLLAAGEIDVTYEPAEQTRGIHAGARVARSAREA